MSRVTTKTGLANLTASLMKQNSVASIDPPDQGSKFAKSAAQWYEDTRREVLADHIWNFAETEDTISAASVAPKAGRFSNRYALPSNYIRLAWLGDEEIPEKDYKIKGGYIYTNLPSPIEIGYIFDEEDITAFSPKFIMAFARRLASNMAYEITGNRTFADELEDKYYSYLSESMSIDGQESPPTHKIRSSKWKAAKEGRSLHGADYQGRVVT